MNYLRRIIDELAVQMKGVTSGSDESSPVVMSEMRVDTDEVLVGYANFIGVIGMWLGELHAIPAAPTEDPSFDAHIADAGDAAYWIARVSEQLIHAHDGLATW